MPDPSRNPVDEPGGRSRRFPPSEALIWAAVGSCAAMFLLGTQAAALGSVSSLLQVGVESRLAPFISGLFPDIHLVPGGGTDGQTYFAIANDLTGSFAPDLMASPGLRYSRLAFPWLSSLGGMLRGAPVLYGMLTVIVISAGVATAATMGLAAEFGLSRKVAFGLFGNLGWFLGIRVLTPDPLGMALMLGGLLAGVRGRPKTSIALLTVAALTKEPYYAGALALAIWLWVNSERLRAVFVVLIPAAAVAASSAYTNAQIGAFADAPNIAWPFTGIVEAAPFWTNAPPKDLFYSLLAIATIILAAAAGWYTKNTLLRWCAWGWAAIGILGSDWIWLFGNSTARVLAPAWLFAVLGFASGYRIRSSAARGGVEAETIVSPQL